MAVLNKHHLPGKWVPEGAVYIGRGSPWGNPYVIGLHGTRAEVIAQYKKELWVRLKKGDSALIEALAALYGKDLVCFCKPAPCHGDVLEKAAAWAHGQLSS